MRKSLLLFSLLLPGIGFAQTTGRDLQALCSVQPDGACVSYVAGVVEGAAQQYLRFAEGTSMFERLAVELKRLFCLPPGSTPQMARDVVLQYLAGRPDEQNEPSVIVSIRALGRAFPCIP